MFCNAAAWLIAGSRSRHLDCLSAAAVEGNQKESLWRPLFASKRSANLSHQTPALLVGQSMAARCTLLAREVLSVRATLLSVERLEVSESKSIL